MNQKTSDSNQRPQQGPAARIFVPVDPLSPHETELTISLNGECRTLPLGRLVTLPEAFCHLIVDSGRADGFEPSEQG